MFVTLGKKLKLWCTTNYKLLQAKYKLSEAVLENEKTRKLKRRENHCLTGDIIMFSQQSRLVESSRLKLSTIIGMQSQAID